MTAPLVLNLFQHTQAKSPGFYLAIASENAKDIAFQFSPQVMLWSENVAFVYLYPCDRYWQTLARERRLDLFDLWHTVLEKIDPLACAVLCDHPFKALLVLQIYHQKGLKGFYHFSQTLTEKWFSQVGVDLFFEMVGVLNERLKTKRSKLACQNFSTQRKRLEKFFDYFCITRVADLKKVSERSVSRRFGRLLSRVWRWVFGERVAQDSLFFLQDFPWIPESLPKPVFVKRHFDFAVKDWEVLWPFLQEDLKRLQNYLSQDSRLALVSFSWVLHLTRSDPQDLSVRFRNPYRLSEDASDFKAANTQFSSTFERYIQGVGDQWQHDHDFGILSWHLECSESVLLPEHMHDFLGEDAEEAERIRRLLQLENTLSCELEHYETRAHLQPEHSFQQAQANERTFDIQPWRLAAALRPLYCFERPVKIDAFEAWDWQFLEQAPESWWLAQDLQKTHRNYYLMVNEKGQRLWSYRDTKGKWYQHGIFV